MAKKPKKKVFNASTEVRAIARERLGRVKPTVEIIPKAERKPKFMTRKRNRCKVCGRPRGYLRKFQLCRICFRQLSLSGEVPGVVKSSW